MTTPAILDWDRVNRVGITEAVLCEPKTADHLVAVLDQARSAGRSMLLTRLTVRQLAALPSDYRARIDYEEVSRTGFFGAPTPIRGPARVAVVTGGTSDIGVAREAVRALLFHGHAAVEIYDVGVAGLWRIQHLPAIAEHQVVIACAGMDAALPTLLAGLVPGLVFAVPTSVGYGVAEGGRTALHSCAPGLAVVNIDNGYGAACAAMKRLCSMADRLAALMLWLRDLDSAAVAVSGGVDSMTLAVIAHRTRHAATTMFHAVSPAVPSEATERVRRYARSEGWDLQVFDAGEFGDEPRGCPRARRLPCHRPGQGTIGPFVEDEVPTTDADTILCLHQLDECLNLDVELSGRGDAIDPVVEMAPSRPS